MKLTGPWQQLSRLLKEGPRNVEREIARATKFNALLVQKAIRENIRSGDHEENSSLTVLFKKSTKPLVDSGELFKAITNVMINSKRAEVGVLKTSATVNYAFSVHQGAIIPVTDDMRNMFYALARYSAGDLDFNKLGARAQQLAKKLDKKSKRRRDRSSGRFVSQKADFAPLKLSTTKIRIPARPFIREVVEDSEIQRRVMENWSRAVAYALSGRGRTPFK